MSGYSEHSKLFEISSCLISPFWQPYTSVYLSRAVWWEAFTKLNFTVIEPICGKLSAWRDWQRFPFVGQSFLKACLFRWFKEHLFAKKASKLKKPKVQPQTAQHPPKNGQHRWLWHLFFEQGKGNGTISWTLDNCNFSFTSWLGNPIPASCRRWLVDHGHWAEGDGATARGTTGTSGGEVGWPGRWLDEVNSGEVGWTRMERGR